MEQITTLKPEHLLPYIPYGLLVLDKDDGTVWRALGFQYFIDENGESHGKLCVVKDNVIGHFNLADVTPILFQQSSIIEKIDWETYEWVKDMDVKTLAQMMREPIESRGGTARFDEVAMKTPMTHYGDVIPYDFMNEVLTWLNKYKVDYMHLIDNGLAESAVNFNPYKQ